MQNTIGHVGLPVRHRYANAKVRLCRSRPRACSTARVRPWSLCPRPAPVADPVSVSFYRYQTTNDLLSRIPRAVYCNPSLIYDSITIRRPEHSRQHDRWTRADAQRVLNRIFNRIGKRRSATMALTHTTEPAPTVTGRTAIKGRWTVCQQDAPGAPLLPPVPPPRVSTTICAAPLPSPPSHLLAEPP